MQTVSRPAGASPSEIRVRVTNIRQGSVYSTPEEWVQLYYRFGSGPWGSARMHKDGFEHYRDLAELGSGIAQVFVVAFSDGWGGILRPVVRPYSYSDGTPDLSKVWTVNTDSQGASATLPDDPWRTGVVDVAAGVSAPAGLPRGLLWGRILTVGDRLEEDVWQVTTNDTGARYAIKLTAMVELAGGDQIELVGECIELLYPAGPLIRVDWLRKFAPDMD